MRASYDTLSFLCVNRLCFKVSDDELMLAYARGDADAFEQLYGRHEGPMLRFVRRLLGTALAAQAEEVFQDTWMRIIAAREKYVARDDASWRTWAFTIAHHAAMDRLRTSGREKPLELADDADDPMEWLQAAVDMSHPSSEDVAFWRAAGQQLLECLDALPVAQRAAFLLHHEEGASVEDLARRLALPFETAKSRLRYALQKLRACMQAYLIVLEAR